MRDLMPIGLTTADQLLRLPRGQHRYELVRGELHTMSPAGWRHGVVAARFHERLILARAAHHGGATFIADTGFLLARDPDTVLAPDVSFVRRERLVAVTTDGFFPGAPDLAVEVRSPDDSQAKLAAKAHTWISHGCAAVVSVDPKARTAILYRRDAEPLPHSERDALDLAFVVPGCTFVLAELFDD